MLFPIFSESQTGSHKISNVCLWPPGTPGDPGVPWGPQWSSELGRLGGQDGVKQTKSPLPVLGGVVLSSDPGLSGPSLESGVVSGVPADSKSRDTGTGGEGREGRGAARPTSCLDPRLRN